MIWRYGIVTIFCLVSWISVANSYRILTICPRASLSHQVVLRGLNLALNERGHEIVFVTTDPLNDKTLKNYTEIDVSGLYRHNVFVLNTVNWLEAFKKFGIMMNKQTDEILKNPEFRKIYEPGSGEKFDLILLEMQYWPAFYPLAKRFDAPIIGITPMGLTINVHYAFGSALLPSHPANWEFYTSGPHSFYQRLKNFIYFWKFIYYYKVVYTPTQEEIARKYFGDDIPDLLEVEKNISVIFENQQAPIAFVKPSVPKFIGISGFHISKQIKPLPQDLKKILDDATQGFVYMSLGSNMKSSMLSEKTLDEFIAAFSKLPYKVLWKFENDVLPNKPDNVHIMKWVPQRAVLAHPNLKVYLYQGGLQSTEEAVTAGVPLIGMPTWADQRMQVDKMVLVGVAKKLLISTIDRNDLEEAILTVATETSYKKNMLHLRTLLKENSRDLLNNAIWWTEHVIRNKGAQYLHCSTADEPWYRRQDMDIIALISAAFTTISLLLLLILYKLLIRAVNIIHSRFDVTIKQKVS